MRKRFLCLSMACVLSVAALAACSGGNGGGNATPVPSKPDQTKEEQKTKPAENESKTEKPTEEQTTEKPVDLGGLEVIIGDWWTNPDAKPETKAAQATADFREEMMKKYNYKVVQKAIASWGEFNDGLFANDVNNNNLQASVYVLDSAFVTGPMNNDLFYDLSTLKNIDLDDEKWNQSTISLMTRGDHVYGLSIGATEPRLGVFFNKRILKKYGFDENYLYDLQKAGKWTWEEYDKVCAACTKDDDGDGVMDTYGTASFSADFFSAVTTGAGVDWVYKDETGHYVNNITSPEWTAAMNWGVDMLSKYEMPDPTEGATWNWFIAAFKDGKVAMTVAEEYKVGDWKDMEDDWGFVMFPYADKKTLPTSNLDHCVQLVRENVLVLPKSFTAEEAENVAFVLDKYANPTPGYEADDDWTASYYNAFRDDRAVDETLTEMRKFENQVLNYRPLVSVDGLTDGDINFNVYTSYGNTPASTPAAKAEEIKDVWDSVLEDLNKKF